MYFSKPQPLSFLTKVPERSFDFHSPWHIRPAPPASLPQWNPLDAAAWNAVMRDSPAPALLQGPALWLVGGSSSRVDFASIMFFTRDAWVDGFNPTELDFCN